MEQTDVGELLSTGSEVSSNTQIQRQVARFGDTNDKRQGSTEQVIKTYLAPRYEAKFSKRSYGYRPEKNAHQAIGECQQDCWKSDWVIDLDIKGFFDNIVHEWMLRMLKEEVAEQWVLMYIERWLQAPEQFPDGTIKERTKGTPQGGVISPLLANVYLHYAIDMWLEHRHKGVTFQRYADDIVIHCKSKEAAQSLLSEIKERLFKFGLELSEEKTKIVYCKKGKCPERKGEEQVFKFLGHEFKPKTTKNRRTGELFIGYLVTISQSAKTKMQEAFRALNLHVRSDLSIEAIAEMINAKLRGWISYYGKYGSRDLWNVFKQLNYRLLKWWKRKHKTRSIYKAIVQLKAEQQNNPHLFAHWQAGYTI
jgi:RNA-directed DNA polymerase